MELQDEIQNYPRTGRFLAGRLRHDMSIEEKVSLENMVASTENIADGIKLIERGQTCQKSTMLIDGFMLRTLESNGKRYGVSFHVPGDFVDLHCFTLKRLDHNIESIGPVRVGYVPHDAIRETMDQQPHLARLFWFSTLLDAAMHREWIMKLEQLTAPKRIAHIVAEIWYRMRMVGLGYPDGFETPLTQADIADMCGATTIHTNRAIGELRKKGLADFNRGSARILDRTGLESYADFSPDYLYGDGILSLRAPA